MSIFNHLFERLTQLNSVVSFTAEELKLIDSIQKITKPKEFATLKKELGLEKLEALDSKLRQVLEIKGLLTKLEPKIQKITAAVRTNEPYV